MENFLDSFTKFMLPKMFKRDRKKSIDEIENN